MARSTFLLIISTLLLTSYAESSSSSSEESDEDTFVSRIAVANRGSKDGLLIESENEASLLTIQLDATAEPMYISAAPLTNEFYIGDRGNKQIYVYDTTTLKRVDIISGCDGIFHQFYNFLNQLWVVCDKDLTILVIDTEKRQNLATISISNLPAGFKPHDITANTEYAFVSLLKPGDSTGYIVQYSTKKPFKEVNRISIGGDPHLWLDSFDESPDYVYVASQTAGLVYKIDIDTLGIVSTLSINGAHGIWGTSEYLYVTDITSSDGKKSLFLIDPDKFDGVTAFDAKSSFPHNLMINSDADKLFLTHSAPGDVSVYDIKSDGTLDNGRIIFSKTGSIPFGIMNLISFDELKAITDTGGD